MDVKHQLLPRALMLVASVVFAVGLPVSSAHALGKGIGIGKGIGKGKGLAVSAVSYHCLGHSSQQVNAGSPYSYLADSLVLDAGNGVITHEGAATGDLVVDSATPAQMAAANVTTEGLTLQPFDTCSTSSGSLLTSVVKGVSLGDQATSGAAYVEFRFNYHARLEFQNNGDPEGGFSAYTETAMEIPGMPQQTFRVTAEGNIVDVPAGITVTDLSAGSHYVYEVSGTYTVEGQLFYGPEVTNVVQTMFTAGGKISSTAVDGGSRIVAGFASAEAMNTLTYEVNSLDPNVVFSFEPEEKAGNATPLVTNTDIPVMGASTGATGARKAAAANTTL
jgi:hypothetical protein